MYGQYDCGNCKVAVHYAKHGDRYSLIISSSMMHGWRGDNIAEGKYRGDQLHIDEITIPGATIEDLQLAFDSGMATSSQLI